MTQITDTTRPGAPGLSVCMIVRNEERLLPECLASIRPWVDEICIVDTGSTDRTVAIAHSFGARTAAFPWADDFSAARNASLDLATQPWVLVIDADEVFDQRTGPDLRRALAPAQGEAPLGYLVQRQDQLPGGRTSVIVTPRLFRNQPGIRFSRPVHEDVSESLARLGCISPPLTGVRLLHRGFLPELWQGRGKAARNLGILRAHVARTPDDLFSTWQLTVALARQPGLAIERFATLASAYTLAQGLSPEARAVRPFLPLVYADYAGALAERGELTRALEVVGQGLGLYPGNVDLCYRNGDLLRRIGDFPGAQRLLQACMGAERPSLAYAGDPGVRGVLPAVGLALIALEQNQRAEAERLTALALQYDAGHVEARCLQARMALSYGTMVQLGGLMSELSTSIPTAPQVRALAGEVSWIKRDRVMAMDLWRGAVRADDGSDAVNDAVGQLALAELGMGNRSAAVSLLSQLTARDLGSAACRVIAGTVAGVPISIDAAFRTDEVLRHVRFWLHELHATGRKDVLASFMRHAGLVAERLPGITQLVVAD